MGAYGWYLTYCRAVNAAIADNPHWRRGQTYVNILTEHDPSAMMQLQDSGFSPFYDDEKIFEFLKELVKYKLREAEKIF